MKFQQQIGNYTVVANCPEIYGRQVTSLFEKFSELNRRGPALRDGTVIRFGWSDLKLSLQGNELIITEPDFGGNPFRDYLPQVTITLEVLTEQVDTLKRTGANGVAAGFRDKVIISKDCLKQEKIYLERTETDEEGDSGWYIGEVEAQPGDPKEKELEAIYLFQLYQIRPALMKVLSFPAGYLIVFNGDNIEAVLNDKNKNIWI